MLFDSLFNTAQSSVDQLSFVFSLISSLVLGTFLSVVYRYKGLYTKSFATALALLPGIVHVVIFLVNGNIGTGMAAMGAFSLIRFRSASGGAKELLVIFIAMAIGLATGMGYVVFAAFFTVAMSAALLLFEYFNFGKSAEDLRELTLKVPDDFDFEDVFETLLTEHTDYYSLQSIVMDNDKDLIEVKYIVRPKVDISVKMLLDILRDQHEQLTITLRRNDKKISKL